MENYIYELEKALFYNDYGRAVDLFQSDSFSKDLLIDSGDFKELDIAVPIYIITQLWNEILPGNWPYCQEAVDKQKVELEKISAYIESVFHINTQEPIDMMKYRVLNWDYHSDLTMDNVFYEPLETYISKGIRPIDIELYYRAKTFDFPEVEKLLKQGADDTVCFEDDDDFVYGYMRDDILEREWWQTKTLFPHPDYSKRKYYVEDINAMFCSASKKRMRKLLNKYYDINHPE